MSEFPPSLNGDNGEVRGSDGRFKAGNPGGPGNPFVGRIGEYRRVIHEVITPEELSAVVRKMLAQAKAGDGAAQREILDRTLGKEVAVKLEALVAKPASEQLTDANLLWMYLEGHMPKSHWLPRIADRYGTGHLQPVEPPGRCV